jgi:NADH:ubiquinone reductase (non-electrogenic)
MAEFKQLLRDFDGLCRSYPATAQVAKQEGEYLAAAFNAGALLDEARGRGYPEFAWHNKGSLAFIGGGEAVASLPGIGIFKGWETGMLWKGFETSSQQSIKGRTSVLIDQVRASVFGRDISTGGMGSAFRAKPAAAAEQQKK